MRGSSRGLERVQGRRTGPTELPKDGGTERRGRLLGNTVWGNTRVLGARGRDYGPRVSLVGVRGLDRGEASGGKNHAPIRQSAQGFTHEGMVDV